MDRVSRCDRDLLFENDFHERIESGLACPELGYTPTVDDRSQLGMLFSKLQSMRRKCFSRKFQIRASLSDDRIPHQAATLERAARSEDHHEKDYGMPQTRR